MTTKRKVGRPSKNDSRRTEILEKAAECFSLNGYNKTTLDQIGDALGFNKAALYYYYKDKEDLFSSVLRARMLKIWEDMKKETDATEGLENKLLTYFDIKTERWMSLLKINGISKENIMNLNMNFETTIYFYKNIEIEYLTALFSKYRNNYTDKQLNEFIIVLLDTQTDLTMNGLLLNDIMNNKKNYIALKEVKRKFLTDIIKSFNAGYFPA